MSSSLSMGGQPHWYNWSYTYNPDFKLIPKNHPFINNKQIKHLFVGDYKPNAPEGTYITLDSYNLLYKKFKLDRLKDAVKKAKAEEMRPIAEDGSDSDYDNRSHRSGVSHRSDTSHRSGVSHRSDTSHRSHRENNEQIKYTGAPSTAMTPYKPAKPSNELTKHTKNKCIYINDDPYSRMRVTERSANGSESRIDFLGDIARCTRNNADGTSITFEAITQRR